MFKIKWYDKYHKVNVEIIFEDDELHSDWFSSFGSFYKERFTTHSPDVEDYELKRWSDLENISIINTSYD